MRPNDEIQFRFVTVINYARTTNIPQNSSLFSLLYPIFFLHLSVVFILYSNYPKYLHRNIFSKEFTATINSVNVLFDQKKHTQQYIDLTSRQQLRPVSVPKSFVWFQSDAKKNRSTTAKENGMLF